MAAATRLLAALAAFLAGAAPAAAQTTLHEPKGTSNQFLGLAVAGAGDVNGDGLDDVIGGTAIGELARVWSGANGQVLHDFAATAPMDDFGESVACAGDVDLDGFPDIAIGAPQFLPSKSGFARIYSGRTGALLRHYSGNLVGDDFGAAVACAGDVDGDGVVDLLVGAPQPGNFIYLVPQKFGYARVHSGATGAALYTLGGHNYGSWFGKSVAAAGDLDQDGFGDFLVGAPQGNVPSAFVGSVHVVSGQNGVELQKANGGTWSDRFGWSVASTGDLDGDGMPEFAVGAPQAQGDGPGYVRLLTGPAAATVRTLQCDPAFQQFGTAVAALGDLDGDGLPEIAVGAPGCYTCPGAGMVEVRSGADASLVFRVEGLGVQDRFGIAAAGAGDVNADGMPDLVVGSPENDAGGNDAGSVRAVSGAALSLIANVFALPAAAGGQQSLTLVAGPAHAGEPYLVLGTLSGSAPGTPVDGLVLPLNVDSYLLFCLANPGAPPLAGGFGVLDGLGRSTAALVLPPGLASSVAGQTAHHAFVAFGPAGVSFASSATALVLLP